MVARERAKSLPAALFGFPEHWPNHYAMRGHDAHVSCLSFSPGSTQIVSGSADSTLRFWDCMTGASVGEPLRGHSNAVSFLALSPDGRRIANGCGDGVLCLWDWATRLPMLGDIEGITCISFSPDGSRVVSVSDDRTLRL